MSNIKWLVLGYFLAFSTHGCDAAITDSGSQGIVIDPSTMEYGDYGTVSWNPIYVKIVE